MPSAHRDRLISLGNREDFEIRTYDSLMRGYQHGSTGTLNILSLTKDYFEIKYLHRDPNGTFAYLSPDEIVLTMEQKKKLIDVGYDINEWEKGELLTFNEKRTWRPGGLSQIQPFDDP